MADNWDQFARASDDWDQFQPVEAPAKAAKKGGIGQMAGDALAGLVRGAGSIGATLVAPYDIAKDALAGKGLSLESNRERRASIDAGLETMGADPESVTYQVGKVGGEIAGTAGLGPVIAGGLRATPLVAKAPNLLEAISTAGMRAGGATGASNLLARTAGGAVTGGAAAGAVDPEFALTGGAIGGAAPGAIKAVGMVSRAMGRGTQTSTKSALGLSTGVGPEPISQAYKAGVTKSADFLENLKGEVPLTDVLDRAKQGLSAMAAEKSAQYRSGMIPIGNDKTVLSLKGIDKAIADASSIVEYKGLVKNESAGAAVSKMRAIVDEWKMLPKDEFHTPEGLDALKQKLGGVLEAIPFQEKTARLAAGKIYNSVKSEIEGQAPAYAKVMKDYQSASDQIHEIEKALSLGNKASKDTAMRKLQSLMRNNVQTNYGNRLNLATSLEQGGGVELMPSLAGQALNSWTPRSLSGQIGSGLTAGAAFFNPLALAALLPQSPRLVGSAAYGLGRMAGGTANAMNAAQQSSLGQSFARGLGGPNALEQLTYRGLPVAVSR